MAADTSVSSNDCRCLFERVDVVLVGHADRRRDDHEGQIPRMDDVQLGVPQGRLVDGPPQGAARFVGAIDPDDEASRRAHRAPLACSMSPLSRACSRGTIRIGQIA